MVAVPQVATPDTDLARELSALRIHDHACLIHESAEERTAALAAFVRIGLERGDRCAIVTAESRAGELDAALRAEGVDADAALASGALELVGPPDVGQPRAFGLPNTPARELAHAVRAAERAGYRALRVAVDMAGPAAPSSAGYAAAEVEGAFERQLRELPALALCLYDRRALPPDAVADVIRAHPLVAFRGVLGPNPFHVPLGESRLREPKRTAVEAERMLLTLRRDTLRRKAMDARLDKFRQVSRAYVDIIASVTHNKLLLMTDDEIETVLGDPVAPERSVRSLRGVSPARAEIGDVVESCFSGSRDVGSFLVGVGEGLVNAVKHAGAGRYDVRCLDGTAQVVIRDNGPGMDLSELSRATPDVRYFTHGELGLGFTIMLETSDRILLSTRGGETTLVLELAPAEERSPA